MAHLDDLIGLPRAAVTALPLLLLPTVLGAGLLLLAPDSTAGKAAVVFSTVAVAWYVLGGAISLAHVRRRVDSRRALHAIRAEVAAAPEPVWVCDGGGRVLFANAAATTGFAPVRGRRISDLVATLQADPEAVVDDLQAHAGRGGYAELRLPGGHLLALARSEDAPLQIWSYHRPGDQAAQSLVAELLEPLSHPDDFEALPIALLRLGADGHVRRANLAARRLVGPALTPADHSAVHLGSLLEGPGRAVGDWIAEVAEGRNDARTEMLRLRHGDGDQHVQVTLSPDPAHETGVLAALSDASALKTLEAQFVQSQKMQAIGQLAGGVAHDFNNLLTAIGGHCDLLMMRRDKADPDYADLDQISQNANRAAALVGQLLAFSRKQTLKPEVLDLRDILSDVAHLLNRLVGERVGLTILHDPALKPIRADRRQLEQVIMNLAVNARDAMPQGGEITVRTDMIVLDDSLSRDRVSLPRGEYARVQVRDEGCGIPTEIMSKIFEPFFTTKRTGEGTGLGLSTAYGIVKQSGGYIFCDSVLGQGTVFSLYFPAHVGPLPVADVPVPTVIPGLAEHAPGKATVLLVEDEAPVRAFAARALRLKGYDVREADSAEAALALLADERIRIDVFVTDVVMPGMDGPSWVRKALLDRPRTRTIFISGYTEDIFSEGHAPVPNSAFLAKPFTLAELTQKVADQLGAIPGGRPH